MPKKAAKNILESPGHSPLTLESFEPVLIVDLSLFRICEHLVRCIDLFELICIASSVGMKLNCQFFKSLSDLFLGRTLGNAQYLIELRVVPRASLLLFLLEVIVEEV